MSKLKKGDLVRIISGKDKGKQGKILKLSSSRDKALVEGINLMHKALKPNRGAQEKGKGIIQIESFIHISNLRYLGETGLDKIVYRINDNGEKKRFAKRQGGWIDG